jgi:putative membrane protein
VLAAANVPFPSWTPHPDVWLLIGTIAVLYVLAITRLGPRVAPTGVPVVTRFQVVSFFGGVATLLVASDWPIHDLGERYLFSVHMIQHSAYAIIAAPLLLIGTPTWLARWILTPRWFMKSVRYMSRFIPATLLFNFVVIFIHIPSVVNVSLHHALVHFAVHTLVVVSSLIVWMPLLSPLPEVPRLPPLGRMLFLFMQTVVPMVPASFLTFGETPLYKYYEHVPRLWNISALDDMRMAGLIMKIVVGFFLIIVIGIVFFRWYDAEETGTSGHRVSRELDRELMGLRQS